MGILDWFTDRIDDLADLVDDAKDTASDIVDDIKDTASDVIDDAKDAVTDIVHSNIAELVGGIVTGKILTDAVEDQVNEDVRRLNKVNKENESIVKDTNAKIQKMQCAYEQCMKKMSCQRKEVFSDVLKPYHEQMKQLIADSRFVNNQQDSIVLNMDMEEITNIDYSREEYNVHGMFHILTGTVGVAFAKGILTSVHIENDIEKAKEENARLKAEKAKIDVKCASIQEIISFLESAYEVVDKLKVEVERYIDEIRNLILRKGRYCSNFSNQDINMLKNSINLVVLLNQIVNTNMLNEKGCINPIYEKYIRNELNKEH